MLHTRHAYGDAVLSPLRDFRRFRPRSPTSKNFNIQYGGASDIVHECLHYAYVLCLACLQAGSLEATFAGSFVGGVKKTSRVPCRGATNLNPSAQHSGRLTQAFNDL